MPKNKCGNKSNKEDNINSPKEHGNTAILECEEEENDDMPEKKFRRMIIRLFKNSENQIHKLKILLHSMGKKKKFAKSQRY